MEDALVKVGILLASSLAALAWSVVTDLRKELRALRADLLGRNGDSLVSRIIEVETWRRELLAASEERLRVDGAVRRIEAETLESMKRTLESMRVQMDRKAQHDAD